MAVAPMIENGDVKFRRRHGDLIGQLTMMSPRYEGHDDVADAWIMAVQLVKDRPRILPTVMAEPSLPSWDQGLTLVGTRAGSWQEDPWDARLPVALRD